MWLYTQFCDLISFLVFFIKNIRCFCLHILFVALIVVLVAYFDIYGKDVLFGVFISIGAAVIFESYRFYKKSKVSEPLLNSIYNRFDLHIRCFFMSIINMETSGFLVYLEIPEKDREYFLREILDINISNDQKINILINIIENYKIDFSDKSFLNSEVYDLGCQFYKTIYDELKKEMGNFLNINFDTINLMEDDKVLVQNFLELNSIFSSPDIQDGFKSGKPCLTFAFIVNYLNKIKHLSKMIEKRLTF